MAITLMIAWFTGVGALVLFAVPKNLIDFSIYYSAAEALRHNPHAAIYAISTLSDTYAAYGGCRPSTVWGYIYQPLPAVLIEPLTLLPCGSALIIWQALSITAWFCSVLWLAWDVYRHGGVWRALAAACLVTLYEPIVYGLSLGQVHLILLAVLVASVMLVEHGHARTAGALLAFGVFLKYLPIVIIGYYTLRGQWRVALGALAGGAVMGIVELVVVGPRLVLESVQGAMSGLHAAAPYTMATVMPLGEPAGKLAVVLFVAGVLLVSQRVGIAHRVSWSVERLGEAWALTTMILISPLIWLHYLTWLLPAFVTVLCATKDLPLRRGGRAAIVTLALLAYALTQTPIFQLDIVATYGLWCLCGTLFLYGAGIKLPIRAVQVIWKAPAA